MRKILFFSGLILIFSCTNNSINNESVIKGDWAFIDGYGFYNETCFSDSTFFTYHQKAGFSQKYNYVIQNDTFFANIDRRKPGKVSIASIEYLPDGYIVLITEFAKDTLERIKDDNVLSELKTDTSLYLEKYKERYEEFLIARNITTKEEIEEFKKTGKAPEDLNNN